MSENNMKENTNINEGETVEKAVVEGENVSMTISTDSNETSNEAIPEETVNTEASDDEIKKIKKIKRKARLQGAICSLLIMIVILGAAEIFTAALSDNGVATTVGTLTFGKGIVQDILDLPDGSGLKITSAEYYTPDGECIHKKGIEPDIVVEFDSEKYIESNKEYDSQLEKAKEVIKEKLK